MILGDVCGNFRGRLWENAGRLWDVLMTDVGNAGTSLGKGNLTETKDVKKHSAIIHCSNSLTLLQRKISNALLYHAYHDLLTEEEHQISMSQLCGLILYKGHNYEVIKDALKGMISIVLEWNLVDDETQEEDWTASAILASVNLKKGICTYAYSPQMKKLLYSPSMFGKINLYLQSHFRSSYGLALYENCTRYQNLPFTKWFEMAVFRRIMGVPDNTYADFKDFKKRVLDKAIEEVNTFSDLFIEPEFQKKGRQVTKIRFSIKLRQKKKRLGVRAPNENSIESESVSELHFKLINKFKLNLTTIAALTQKYSKEYIMEKIGVIESSKSYHSGKVENLPGLLIEALNSNYNNINSTQIDKRNTSTSVQNKQTDLAKQKSREEHRRYQVKCIKELIEQNNLLESEEFKKEFIDYLGHSMYTDIYLRDGFKNILIQDQLYEFILNSKNEIINSIPSFEYFINQKIEMVT